MFHSEPEADSSAPSSQELVSPEEGESSPSEDMLPSQPDFIPWQEEPLPKQAVSMVGHRRIIKSSKVRRGMPRKITPEVSLEPEPEPEGKSIEVTPITDGETVVGLRIACGCGATHEVHFEYRDEQ